MDTKLCACCHIYKPLNSFGKNKKSFLGLDSYCKLCKLNNQRQHRNNKKLQDSHVKKFKRIMSRRIYTSKWKKENPGLVKEQVSIRKLQRKRCGWANKEKINSYYAIAKFLSSVVGIPYHVDHIIPLQGKLVSGLHVENNLAIIPAKQNLSKGNKWVLKLN